MKENNSHIILNGEIYPANAPVISATNRAFRYGDAVFETMRATGSNVHFAEEHFERLFKAIDAFKMNAEFTPFKLLKDIQRLINRNKLFSGVRIRVAVFREGEGLFTPISNSCRYLISCDALDNIDYILNSKGLHIGVFNEIRKNINKLSFCKNANSILNVMAGIYAKENQWDDCLIINDQNQIIESFHSNLFLVKNNSIFTPPVQQGCVDGVMRKQILAIAGKTGIKVSENIVVSEGLLLEADEIFLTNTIDGIRWVLAFKNRRYFNNISRLLIEKLNEIKNQSK